MPTYVSGEPVDHPGTARKLEARDMLGPTIEFLWVSEQADASPCVMRSTIPPGVTVPLQSHADPEIYLVVSGELEGLKGPIEGFKWLRIAPGDVLQVPAHAKHAFRNRSSEPAVMIIVSTMRMGRFFREIGRSVGSDTQPLAPPSAERDGYWNATADANAEIGMTPPGAS